MVMDGKDLHAETILHALLGESSRSGRRSCRSIRAPVPFPPADKLNQVLQCDGTTLIEVEDGGIARLTQRFNPCPAECGKIRRNRPQALNTSVLRYLRPESTRIVPTVAFAPRLSAT